MRFLLTTALALALPLSSVAQTLDCAALANSHQQEPAGWAAQCGGPVPAPSVVTPRAPTDIAFTIDIRGQAPRPANTLYSFVLNNFSAQTTRGATNPSIFSIDFTPDGGTLYGVTGNAAAPNPSTLGTINTTTGAFTPVAALTGLGAGENPTGITIHPVTGAAYLSSFGNGQSQLYALNLDTGAVTLIGSMGPNVMIDIAMNCDGELYAHSITDDALYSINPTTGASTQIGLSGLDANFAQGMDFDNDDGSLYGFLYIGGGANRFGTFNLATGAFTTLVQDNPLGEYVGAVPTQCPAQDADLSITKTSNAPAGIQPGSNFSYTLNAINAGPANATGVVVTDTLPAQVTYVSNTCGAAFAAGTVTWTVGALASGANTSCNITVTLNSFGVVINTATIQGEQNDPVTANNAAVASFEAMRPAIAVPTIGQWGLLLLGALVLLVAGSRLYVRS